MDIKKTLFVFGLFICCALCRAESQWSGEIGIEGRLFPQSANMSVQDDQHGSIFFEPEYYFDFAEGSQRIVLNPFFRYDASDDERSHADLRELYWRGTFNDADIKLGIAKVFWGVTESQHLVDVINQTDLVENIDAEDKLGQPMVNLNLVKDWGTLEFYILPYFRERTFPGEEGRLRSSIIVDTDHVLYENSDEENHVDYAARWSHYFGPFDIGVAHFSGTSRDPVFIPVLRDGEQVLSPYYQQIEQTSIDMQATLGNWLWKLEAISNKNELGRYSAAVGGFEYTFVGVSGSASDLGVLIEYHFDDRDDDATTSFQDDIFTGLRWVLNDVQSTEVLIGAIIDSDSNGVFGNIEASRRLGESWKLSLEGRLFSGFDENEIFYELRNDDYIEFKLSKFF